MSNPYSVVLDADVLAKGLHRNILLNLAAAECFKPIWSDTILTETETETETAIAKLGGDGSKRRGQLERAFPSAMAESGYIHLVRKIQLVDENDRHVVAVALQESADAICSDNKRDFGLSTVDVFTSDEFITNTIDLATVQSLEALAQMRRSMTSVSDGSEFLELMKSRGLNEAGDYLSKYSDRL
ncbi:PIN domain-containing protein [Pseudohalocynthiibacter aestuariivivens]|uniref:PIN domain-containing protein n=1 Tax=Pseudohalocynthiibacter aestuariivivens TaxID=1591409 RepID=A0ABV5JKN1_9RHOB|nr:MULTISPECIES: PIN domain-containing protein [Pseudohalocynthiibacter]MBS9717540.1 PIN domain-containing protein [Pseudohalocynthiibacter aestuariivivens]MCK0102725.1 PIN domain-containing protein [Pseudohalocynthiibacter sp. F2068]